MLASGLSFGGASCPKGVGWLVSVSLAHACAPIFVSAGHRATDAPVAIGVNVHLRGHTVTARTLIPKLKLNARRLEAEEATLQLGDEVRESARGKPCARGSGDGEGQSCV
eukprot:CAMPEP_0185546460 /NCGR_PEP_ID=MMETSP1381-20130426/5484_1 /TAXON_ID=298111 /ORGANISM="Pavlova sp., Strain CCMP459" /LENGTH=109 /DNA_ID=CAMNT_0028158903 /DNA_START=264 /DNA_END=588 /DNA_ORIENTATION=+